MSDATPSPRSHDPRATRRAIGRGRRKVLGLGALALAAVGAVGAIEGIPRAERDLERRTEARLGARGITGVDSAALEYLVSWSRQRLGDLRARVREQIGVVDDGLTGFTLSGILPMVGRTHAFRVVNDPFVAFDLVGGEGGRAVCAEVLALAAQAQGSSAILYRLRAMLLRDCAGMSLRRVAGALGVSPRTLQRDLSASGSSFALELREARFQHASRLLVAGDDKLSAVAHQVGLGETALRSLFRARAGCTPEEFRRQAR